MPSKYLRKDGKVYKKRLGNQAVEILQVARDAVSGLDWHWYLSDKEQGWSAAVSGVTLDDLVLVHQVVDNTLLGLDWHKTGAKNLQPTATWWTHNPLSTFEGAYEFSAFLLFNPRGRILLTVFSGVGKRCAEDITEGVDDE